MINPDQHGVDESIRRTSEEAEQEEAERLAKQIVRHVDFTYIRGLKEIPPEPPTEASELS